MKLAAERTTTALLNSTALQALVNGKHYWEMAPDNTKGIYVAFRIAENIGLSKDRRNYDVTHWCYMRIRLVRHRTYRIWYVPRAWQMGSILGAAKAAILIRIQKKDS